MFTENLGENMRARNKKINKRLIDLGRPLGIKEIDAIKAKRTVKNIITISLFAGLLFLLGNLLAPGGGVGYFYSGCSIKDFKMLLGGWLY